MDSKSEDLSVERTRGDSAWRELTAQTRSHLYAEWARETKGLRPYVSGLECASNMLRLWDIWGIDNLPHWIIPGEERGYTLSELVKILDKVAEVEVWHSECAVKDLAPPNA